MTHANALPARLLTEFLDQILAAWPNGRVLDLACGSGRNGLLLARHNLRVVFADNNPAALQEVAAGLERDGRSAELWLVDLEAPAARPLEGRKFDVILVFNYLHRSLIPLIRESLSDGGLLFYETFTTAQARIGRPRNPEFLLEPGELRGWFSDWEILQDFEGVEPDGSRFYANLAARKPAT